MASFLSMAASEPVLEVAGRAAVLPGPSPVDMELLPTISADIGMVRLVLHQLQVAVPPLHPAFVAAEPLPFPSGHLVDGFAAVLAHRAGNLPDLQLVPLAVGLHRVEG